MKVGLLSDTHGFLDPQIFDFFSEVEEVWHAGDLGDHVLEPLRAFKPMKAVFGNIDSRALQHKLPEDIWTTIEGLSVWMTHIGGSPPRYNPRIKENLKTKVPGLFICGHSHILKVMKDLQHNNMLYLNPGAAGNHGFHQMRTIVRLEIADAAVKNLEVIELGKRGSIPS